MVDKDNVNVVPLPICYREQWSIRPFHARLPMPEILLRIVTGLISFAVLFLLFSIACYLSGHNRLMMLYMYWSPFFLSLAVALTLPLDSSRHHQSGWRWK
jgi:hypothetical protein